MLIFFRQWLEKPGMDCLVWASPVVQSTLKNGKRRHCRDPATFEPMKEEKIPGGLGYFNLINRVVAVCAPADSRQI
jgi:hypothetical protein